MEENLEIQDPIIDEPVTDNPETEDSNKEILEESILNSIKSLLGPTYDDDSFDTDIIIHINTTFTTLSTVFMERI